MSSAAPSSAHDLLLAQTDYLRRLARQLVCDQHQADDVVQEALVIAIERPPSQSGALRGWLGRVVTNLVHRNTRAALRRRQREQRAAVDEAVVATDERAAQQELLIQLAEAARALPEPYRSTIHHRYYDDLTPRQIAANSNLPVATVKTRLRRGLEMLRRLLDETHGGERRSWLLPLVPLSAPCPAKSTAVTSGLAAAALLLNASIIYACSTGRAAPIVEVDPGIGRQRSAQPVAVRPPVEVQRQPLPTLSAPVPATCAVEGRVIDLLGQPVAGLRFQLAIRPGNHKTGDLAWLLSDAKGQFRHELKAPAPVCFLLLFDQRYRRVGELSTLQAPVKDVVLKVRRVPFATLELTLRDFATTQLVQEFACRFHVPAQGYPWPGTKDDPRGWRGGVFGAATKTGKIVQYVSWGLSDLQPGTATRIQIDVSGQHVRRRIEVRAGELHRIEMLANQGPGLAGIVTDASGRPIANALVFAGTEARARGDEPFKPFDPSRIGNGTRTDTRGRYRLNTDATVVTAWHKRFTPTTSSREQAAAIVLPACGRIQGRLIDAAGKPLAGVEVILERWRSTRTDAAGHFVFESVEAGVRGLWVPGGESRRIKHSAFGPWTVRVVPGEKADAVLHPGLAEVVFRFRSGHKPVTDLRMGGLLPLGETGSMRFGRIKRGALRLERVLSGDYLFVSARGHLGSCRVSGTEARVDLGTARLKVTGPPSTRFCLIPENSHNLARVVIRRMAKHRLGEDGTAEFGPLPAGSYQLWLGGSNSAKTVVLQHGKTTNIELK